MWRNGLILAGFIQHVQVVLNFSGESAIAADIVDAITKQLNRGLRGKLSRLMDHGSWINRAAFSIWNPAFLKTRGFMRR